MKLRSEYCKNWQAKFALFPVYVNESNHRVWFETYYQRYIKLKYGGTWECVDKETYAKIMQDESKKKEKKNATKNS